MSSVPAPRTSPNHFQSPTASRYSVDVIVRPSRFRRFQKFLWNRQNRTFCNKTCGSWAFVFIFYTLFSALVVAFFVGFMLALGLVVHKSNPTSPLVDKKELKHSLRLFHLLY